MNRSQAGHFLLEYRRTGGKPCRWIVSQPSRTFWREVWKQPQNPDAIDRLVHEDFVITSGGQDILGREGFKASINDFQARVHNFEFHVVETFQNQEGSRVVSRWWVTGRNNGLMGTEPTMRPLRRSSGTDTGKSGRWPPARQPGGGGMRS